MQRLRYYSVVTNLAFLALLSACGVEVVAQPTPTASIPSSDDSVQTTIDSAPQITQTSVQPTPIPSATIPPTTSPLPSPTPRRATPTLVPDDTTAVTTEDQTVTIEIPNEETAIALIRERYNTINGATAQYRKTERALDGFSTEGGTLEAFYDGTALRKLIATYLGESGRSVEEYYFWDEQVFFVLQIQDTYDEPFGKVVQTAENRLYFVGTQMIRWLDQDRRPIAPTAPEFATRENEQLQQVQKLRALLPS